MAYAATRTALLALALTASACAAVEKNEITLAACTDPARQDEDGDGLRNCDDPDCYTFIACSFESRLLLDGGLRDGAVSDNGDDSSLGGSGGGPSIDPPTALDDAATDADANVEPDAGRPVTDPCAACGSNEVCTDGACVPVDPRYGLYKLVVTSATVPVAASSTRCYDNPCDIGAIPYGVCACSPDPYVRVYRVPANDTSGTGQLAGQTGIKNESVAPAFDPVDILVNIQPGDTLRFEVWDDDMVFADEQMYECIPDITSLLGMTSTIDCVAQTGVGNLELHHVHATLTPATE